DRKANPDLVFVDAMLDQIEADQCIDTSRIYSTGLSNGAFLSSTIACAMSDRIAAVAPVSGLTFTEECRPERPVPVLTFHGTADPILLFNGGVGKRLGAILAGKTDDSPLPEANLEGDGYPKAVRDWAEANGCKTTFEDEKVTDTVTERSYDCPAKGAVVFDIVEGGGHTWPGTKFSIPLEKIVGATDQTLDANDVLWKFFQRFRLPQS
ncbi:MAG: alpha/beta hydrolase family esterase, partial [Acidimicrobiales bacterium]